MRSSFLFASFLAVVPVRFLALNPHIYILIKNFTDYIREPHASSSCSAGSPYYSQKRSCAYSGWSQFCIPKLLRVSINACFFIRKRPCDMRLRFGNSDSETARILPHEMNPAGIINVTNCLATCVVQNYPYGGIENGGRSCCMCFACLFDELSSTDQTSL